MSSSKNEVEKETAPATVSKSSKPVSMTLGAYIPPAKLKLLQASITDKSSIEYQRMAWEALKKSINGLVNKINIPNISQIVRELFKENIVRGRGILVNAVMNAQEFSPTYTATYASLMAIINTKFPQIGELLLKRLIIKFHTNYRQNKKEKCLATCKFIAHLVNQNCAHEILPLQILTIFLSTPTNHSCELAIGLLKDAGKKLSVESPRSLNGIFDSLREILQQQTDLVDDKRIQYMIEVMFAIRKDNFKDYPALVKELDLVDETEQFTHTLSLEDELDGENEINIFKVDKEYVLNEQKYQILKKEILDESDSDDDDEDGESGSSGEEEEDDNEETKEEANKKAAAEALIIDETETNLVSLRRTIYLTIQSSLGFEECAHKLLKIKILPAQKIELCQMLLDACAQQRTFEPFYGLVAQRFCNLNKEYVECFETIFKQQYDTCHRLETVKLRNVSHFFSHLLHTDSISWGVMDCIHLNEDETTSSSRVYLKNLMQGLMQNMGVLKMKARFADPTLQEFFMGLFPRDNPRSTRFSINFFTSIELGVLTEDLREHLKSEPAISRIMNPVALDDPNMVTQEQTIDKDEPKKSKSSKKSSHHKKSSKKKRHHDSDSDSSSSSSSSSSDEDNKKRRKKQQSSSADLARRERSIKKEPVEQHHHYRENRPSSHHQNQQQQNRRSRNDSQDDPEKDENEARHLKLMYRKMQEEEEAILRENLLERHRKKQEVSSSSQHKRRSRSSESRSRSPDERRHHNNSSNSNNIYNKRSSYDDERKYERRRESPSRNNGHHQRQNEHRSSRRD